MALPLVESFNVSGAYGSVDDCKIAGDFLWVLCKSNNSLVRMRPSDGAFLDASGVVTDRAGATVTLYNGSSYPYAWTLEVLGDTLFIQYGDGFLRTFDAVTGAHKVSFAHTLSGVAACVHNGLVWVGEANAGSRLRGFDATGVQKTIELTKGITPWKVVPGPGTLLYYCGNYTTDPTLGNQQFIGVVDTAGAGTELASIQIGVDATQLTALGYDGTYLWASSASGSYLLRVRASDGAVVLPDGSIGTIAANQHSVPLRQASPLPITGGALGYFDGRLWMTGWGASELVCVNPTTQRTLAHFFAPNDHIADPAIQYWSYFAAWRLFYDGRYLWIPNLTSDPVGGFLYRIEITPATAPNLTAVTPGAGPRVSLTFDNPVGIVGPTIGGPIGGVGVVGVAQVDTTHIDLNLALGGGQAEAPPALLDLGGGTSQDYGEDVSTYPDLDPNFILQSGNRVIAETILRMLETPRGSLVYAPDRGYDVRALFGEAITQRTLAQAKRNIEAECLKDERVESVATALDFDAATSTLQIRLEVTTAAGPFRLTLAVTAVSLTILDGGK